ncbi:MAG: signal recognition particle protein Srp19, partial [Candidatus Aenigmarchaeota archaeon]|nr:signal recognition particle protein Srp19 [Candidatus Aenigmarchaeota archaeon]
LIGLFGSGKTTTSGKLGRWFKKRGLSVGLVACDVHRAAAKEQLKQIGKQIDVPVYFDGKKAEDIAKNALKKGKESVMIFDSAGRDALDGELAKELKNLGKIIKPDQTFLVIPADIGQAARKQAEEFNKLVGITGIIVTKVDGTAKGGGALAAAAVSGSKVKMIGVGEKLDNFEEYDPKRFVSRLIGYGDIEGLLEKAKESGAEESAKRIMEGKFTLNEFYDQIGSLQKMGSLSNVMGMIPGFSGGAMTKKMPKDFMNVQEGKMKKWKFVIDSMTPAEREDPDLIKQSRIQRIAKGAGTQQSDIRDLIKNYKQVKKMMKMTGGGKAFKRGPLAKIAKQFGMGM